MTALFAISSIFLSSVAWSQRELKGSVTEGDSGKALIGAIEMGRYDANYGNILKIEKEGKMTVSPIGDLSIDGQVRRIRPIKIGEKSAYIFVKNGNAAQVIAQ